MLALNNHIFLLLNASTDASPAILALARIAASQLITVVPLVLIGLWIWGNPDKRAGLVSTTIAACLALGANQLAGWLWYEQRPFMIGLGHTFVAHVPENSFPSDHTTLILTVGFGLFATRAAPTWGKFVIALGVLVAWARVYLGLHFPIDIIASALIAGNFGWIATVMVAPIDRWVMLIFNRTYENALDALRVSSRAFPRRRDEVR
jgi:undecaprenyl-diphosphatase